MHMTKSSNWSADGQADMTNCEPLNEQTQEAGPVKAWRASRRSQLRGWLSKTAGQDALPAGAVGQSWGRPKEARNKRPALHEERLKDIILDEAYREITVQDQDRNITIPMAQAVIRALAVNAAKGQHYSRRLFAELLSTTENQRKALADQWLDTAMGCKIDWERELDRRAKLGITDLPEPLPHPDHVKIDMNKGTARIIGPATKEEKAEYDLWMKRRVEFRENWNSWRLIFKPIPIQKCWRCWRKRLAGLSGFWRLLIGRC